MCTVVFIPSHNKHYLASLRDESPERATALAPQVYASGRANYLMPKDALAGGTWIGISTHKTVIVLLNGGFKNHSRKKGYVKSRGLIVTELLLSALPVVDWQLMDLSHIEPFTLVVWSDNNLFELVWDGDKKHRSRLDATVAHIWSSSTLYNNTSKAAREDLFQDWIAMGPPIDKRSVLRFFKSTEDSENGFIINRHEKIKTLSYSFVELSDTNTALLDYYDLQNYTHHTASIAFAEKTDSCQLQTLNND